MKFYKLIVYLSIINSLAYFCIFIYLKSSEDIGFSEIAKEPIILLAISIINLIYSILIIIFKGINLKIKNLIAIIQMLIIIYCIGLLIYYQFIFEPIIDYQLSH